jgi:hypothetical protein
VNEALTPEEEALTELCHKGSEPDVEFIEALTPKTSFDGSIHEFIGWESALCRKGSEPKQENHLMALTPIVAQGSLTEDVIISLQAQRHPIYLL